ncbi:MAG TPA: hypothetical protein VJS38_07010, partial [Phenylobacterium sp.]|nr:hypothetical protein [Phenylobacterium sp.]
MRPSDFAVETYDPPALADRQFRVRNLYVSVDPMLRLHLDAAPLGGAIPPLALGALIAGAAVAMAGGAL